MRANRHLLDVNVLVALLDDEHIHHRRATEWFNVPGLRWALCPFAEAGLLRYATSPKTKGLSMDYATTAIQGLTQHAGYCYQPMDSDWQSLTRPFAHRIFGHNQITDAYLLGLAIQKDLVLVTFDRAFLHLAGDYRQHVLLLENAP